MAEADLHDHHSSTPKAKPPKKPKPPPKPKPAPKPKQPDPLLGRDLKFKKLKGKVMKKYGSKAPKNKKNKYEVEWSNGDVELFTKSRPPLL